MTSDTTLQVLVPDMDCSSCVRAITSAVQSVDPHATVAADLESKQVTIGGDGAAGLFIAAIRGAGFSVKAE
jgi:copper chaperone